jgi:hypothetical protein
MVLLSSLFVGMTFLFLPSKAALPFVASAAFAAANIPQQGQVEGEVIQVFPTAIVIKNEQGHGTVLQITPRTQLGAQFKPGDKIVAYVTPYGVSSIQLKASTALIP